LPYLPLLHTLLIDYAIIIIYADDGATYAFDACFAYYYRQLPVCVLLFFILSLPPCTLISYHAFAREHAIIAMIRHYTPYAAMPAFYFIIAMPALRH